MELHTPSDRDYMFATGIAPYSSGVVAAPGYEIVHATLHTPVLYEQGFELIERHLADIGRSRKALCAIELRLPAPLSFEGFVAFNAGYQALLESWDLMAEGKNPIARTNIAPLVGAPAAPSLYAFSYTLPADGNESSPSFVVAGAGDLVDQGKMSDDAVVRHGETSADALVEKAGVVLDEIEARMDGLRVGWSDATVVDVYTVHELHPLLEDFILPRIGDAATHGVHWFLSHPPISSLAFEMDVRGVRREIRLRV